MANRGHIQAERAEAIAKAMNTGTPDNVEQMRYAMRRGEPVIYKGGAEYHGDRPDDPWYITCIDGTHAWIAQRGGLGNYVPLSELSRPTAAERTPRPGRFGFFGRKA